MTTPDPDIRFCPSCRQADNHPRHTWFGDPDDVAKHIDCCAADGCPDGSCTVLVRTHKAGDTGLKMAVHVDKVVSSGRFEKELAALQEEQPELRQARRGDVAPINLQEVPR